MSDWSFLTSHARVLLAIAADPELRGRCARITRGYVGSVHVTARSAHRRITA